MRFELPASPKRRSSKPPCSSHFGSPSRPSTMHSASSRTGNLRSPYQLSPPESVHALDLEKLRRPEVTFWSAWEGSLLLGCGALKELDDKHGEVKSMRTPIALRRKGAARAILAHIIEVARSRSYERLSLETGAMEAFKPAQRLYESFGFTYCGPFGEYTEDPNSVFMTMRLYAKRRPDPTASTHVRDRRR